MSPLHKIWKEIKINRLNKAERALPPERHRPCGVLVYENKFLSVLEFSVSAREWNQILPNTRFIGLNVPSGIPEEDNKARVAVFLEVSGKQVSLPFIYRQPQGSACIHSVCQPGKVYISILGNFIPSVHLKFTFKVLLVKNKIPARFKTFDWENYSAVKRAFDF